MTNQEYLEDRLAFNERYWQDQCKPLKNVQMRLWFWDGGEIKPGNREKFYTSFDKQSRRLVVFCNIETTRQIFRAFEDKFQNVLIESFYLEEGLKHSIHIVTNYCSDDVVAEFKSPN